MSMDKMWNRTNFKLPLEGRRQRFVIDTKKHDYFLDKEIKEADKAAMLEPINTNESATAHKHFVERENKISHWKPKQTKSFWKCVYCKFVKCLRHKTIKNGHKFVPQISAQNLAVSALCGVEARGFVPLKPPLIQIHNSPTAPVLLCTNTAPYTCVYVPLNLTGGSN